MDSQKEKTVSPPPPAPPRRGADVIKRQSIAEIATDKYDSMYRVRGSLIKSYKKIADIFVYSFLSVMSFFFLKWIYRFILWRKEIRQLKMEAKAKKILEQSEKKKGWLI